MTRTTLCQREGAAVRTADDLLLTFVNDAVSCGAVLPDDGPSLEWFNERLYGEYNPTGCYWLDDPEVSEALADLAKTAEEALPEGVGVTWDDGYVIWRQEPDPEHVTLWVCLTCYRRHLYPADEAGGLTLVDDPRLLSAGLFWSEHFVDCENRAADEQVTECGCERITYSRCRCDGCGGWEEGERFALTLRESS